ncbi:hypothetical protein RN001_004328 [Aquatica leii]|uniref:Uncharacterized protein n=1 Tax=Aquatica leii TaxID=1421715 RepID=A0AAN7SI04_9COLE|nr:hypothetical protein RN001_004328 [Aquatica leii]
MSCISIDDTVEIEITDEIDPNLQDTSQYPLPLCAKHRRCGNIYYNDYEPAKTTYSQEQTVGSQPVYYQTGRENSSRFLVCDQYNQRGNNYPDESMFMQSFQQHDIRRNFVRRVYSILSLQLLVTLGFMCVCVFSENVREYIKNDLIGVCIACTKNLSTGYTPAYLSFAREMRTPMDVHYDLRAIIDNENVVVEITPYLRKLASTISRAHETNERQDAFKRCSDLGHREVAPYEPGDKVLVNVHALSDAAQRKYVEVCTSPR